MAFLGINNPLQNKPANADDPSIQHNIGQLFGHTLNAMPGYSTLGSQITNPNVNYLGKNNPATPSNNYWTPPAVLGASTTRTAAPTGNENQTQLGGGGAGAGGGTGSWSYDPQAVLQAQDAISQAQFGLDRIGSQNSIGMSNIANSFGEYRNQLSGQKGIDQRDYNTNRTKTIRDNELAREGIDAQTRQRSGALQRFLGANGAGNSQAAELLAPYAAARTGTKMREQVGRTYGENLQAMDTSWGDYENQYNGAMSGANRDEEQARKDQQAKMLNQQYTGQNALQQGQAALEYARTGKTAEANAARQASLQGMFQILQQIDELSRQAPVNRQAVNYAAPTLQSYNVDQGQGIAGGAPQDQVLSDTLSPSYQYLIKQREDQANSGY